MTHTFIDYSGETTLIDNNQYFSPAILTETQNELVEKFNSAFIEAQSTRNIFFNTIQTDDTYIDQYTNYYDSIDNQSDTNFLLDVLLSKSSDETQTNSVTTTTTGTTGTTSATSTNSNNYYEQIYYAPDETDIDNKNVFYVNPPINTNNNNINNNNDIDDILDLTDIEDFCDLSNSSFDIETMASEICDETFDNYEPTINYTNNNPIKLNEKKYSELNNFIRNSPADCINLFPNESEHKSNYGHLLANKPANNNLSAVTCDPDHFEHFQTSNQIVLTQNEAILHDDVLLSASNVIFLSNKPRNRNVSTSNSSQDCSDLEYDADDKYTNLLCKWEGCFELFADQKCLVRHIEKCHVEVKKGEEFSCFWLDCPRKSKPFNARYKLLIHMRVHSGEKPNKCPVSTKSTNFLVCLL